MKVPSIQIKSARRDLLVFILSRLTSRTRLTSMLDSPCSGHDKDNPSLSASLSTFIPHQEETDPATTANAIFMRQGLEVAGSHHSHTPHTRSDSPTTVSNAPTFPNLVGFSLEPLDESLNEIDPHVMVLPPRQLADDLFRWYWQHVHSIFPFLHWPSFKHDCHSLWKQETPPSRGPRVFEDRLFRATVNMVLALACDRNEGIPLGQSQSYANNFYMRSLRLIPVETLDTSSLSVVQLLLLRGTYLYFAGRADRCWLTVGAAIRVAIGLGLHATPKRPMNQLEREMRRRVWYGGCVSLDQYGPQYEPPMLCHLTNAVIGSSQAPLADLQ
jgi:hypothetical protein